MVFTKKKKIILIISVVVVIATFIVIASVNKGGSKGLTVQTEKVTYQSIVETVNATGKIEPKTQVKISADVAAKITTLGVEEGDWVEKGDLDRKSVV